MPVSGFERHCVTPIFGTSENAIDASSWDGLANRRRAIEVEAFDLKRGE